MKIVLTEGEWAVYLHEMGSQLGPLKDGKQLIHAHTAKMLFTVFADAVVSVESEQPCVGNKK